MRAPSRPSADANAFEKLPLDWGRLRNGKPVRKFMSALYHVLFMRPRKVSQAACMHLRDVMLWKGCVLLAHWRLGWASRASALDKDDLGPLGAPTGGGKFWPVW